MQSFKELEMRFYGNYDVSIDIKSEYEGLDLDIALLSLYTIRMFSNLGGVPELAFALMKATDGNLKDFDLGDHLVPSDVLLSAPRIVTKRFGTAKSINASLGGLPPYGKEPLFGLLVKFYGFGIFGKEINYYAIQSINALIRFYALSYRDNDEVLGKFQCAINRLGYVCLRRSVIAAGNIIQQGLATQEILDSVFNGNLYS